MNKHPLARWLLSATALLVIAIGLSSPAQARAGEFTITNCAADHSNYATSAFEDFATRGMRWRRACDPQGPGLRGLVTGNVAGSGQVADGAQSAFVLEAPPGTTFSRFRWSGAMHRRDCRYALQLYALKPDQTSVAIKNVRANRNCPRPEGAQANGWPRPRAYDLGGATRIVQRVVCMGNADGQFCSARGQNYVQTFTAEATVVDDSGPSVSITSDGPLARGEWVNGTQALGYEASDNVGIREAWPSSGSYSGQGETRTCDYAQRTPCPSGPGHLEVRTEKLPEGTQELHVTARDAGGNQSDSPAVTVRVDNTSPGAVPVSVEGGEAWRAENDYDLAWQNPLEVDRAPIVAAHYRLCRAGTAECIDGESVGVGVWRLDNLNVPVPGEWEWRMWRQDAAGNQLAENASIPVKLRFDPDPPSIAFEAPSPSDPTRVSLQASDALSGMGAGEVAISRVGSGAWQVLPTTPEGSHLTTRIDDAAMPPGEYELRATARDQAGNLAITSQRLDGQPMKLTLPLRASMSLGAGILEERPGRRRHNHKGKAPKATALVRHSQFAYGKEVSFAGHLLDSGGGPLAGAPVQVFALPKEGAEQQVATLTTGEDGGFGYEVPATASQELRFAYAGDATHLPAESKVSLDVSAASGFKVDHKHVLNGQSVTFSGWVRGRPLPAPGKLVELQVFLSKWQTFRTARTGTEGSWSIVYRFKRTCGIERFRFRLRLPEEAGYPLTVGTSRHVTVKVRGQPCVTVGAQAR